MKKPNAAGILIAFILLFSSCGKLSKISKIGLPESDDYKLFASRTIEPGAEAFHFYPSNPKLNLGETIEVDSRRIDAGDEKLDLFLKDHKTLSFLIIRNDSLLYQYFDESKADTSIVTSFSVAKAFISGLIGSYAHGNEPGHHTTFLFNYAGKAWRTQELNRQIQTEMYTTKPDGLCGNEDCGQMSAWYVFSAMGFYPVNPSELTYQFGSPIVQEAKVEVATGKFFTMKAPLASKENKYIQEVKLNGQALDRTFITCLKFQ